MSKRLLILEDGTILRENPLVQTWMLQVNLSLIQE